MILGKMYSSRGACATVWHARNINSAGAILPLCEYEGWAGFRCIKRRGAFSYNRKQSHLFPSTQ